MSHTQRVCSGVQRGGQLMLYRVWVPPKIKRRPPPRTPIDDRQCEVCGVTYSPVRKWQRFCSKPCRRSTEGSKQGPIPPRPCDVCGEDYRPMTRWQRFCSKLCAGQVAGSAGVGARVPRRQP